MKNYYRILGLKVSASEDDIKRSYRTLAKRYHPDVNPGNEEAARKFADINEAHTILSDKQQRAEYDARLLAAQKPAARPQHAAQNTAWQMQMQSQIHAQVQAQVQSQLASVSDVAYKSGYRDGLDAAEKALRADSERYKQKAADFEHDRSDLEQELFDRDRELAQANERIADLESRLNWFRKAGGGVRPGELLNEQIGVMRSRTDELLDELAQIETVQVSLQNNPSTLHETGKQLKERLNELQRTLDALTDGVAALDAETKRRQQLMENEKLLASVETRAAAWSKKEQYDRRLAKPTLYGTLGVLIWATDEEIKNEYLRLSARLSEKTDEDSIARLNKMQAAYAILSDPEKRSDYDRSIGYSAARIEKERRLVAENAKVQDEYRSKLAVKEFWVRFDELSTLALANDADAQNALGEIYFSGKHVTRDCAQAVYWFREAFDQKHPAAMYNLGLCYLNGDGVGRNRSIALALMRQAENLGYHPPAPSQAES